MNLTRRMKYKAQQLARESGYCIKKREPSFHSLKIVTYLRLDCVVGTKVLSGRKDRHGLPSEVHKGVPLTTSSLSSLKGVVGFSPLHRKLSQRGYE